MSAAPASDGRPRRPVLAVVAIPGTTSRLRPLVRHLATEVEVCSLDRVDGPPDAVLVTSVAALGSSPPEVPAAVWVTDASELAGVRSQPAVRVTLSDDREAISGGALAVPPDALDAGAFAVMPPLVRARRRESRSLPARLVVTIGPDADPAAAETTLAVAAAAVVTGPMLALALALGTPTVTTATEADRIGLRPGREVVVTVEADAGADALARAVAVDDEWSARLSVAGRRFVESTMDISRIAGTVLRSLGIEPPRSGRPRWPALLDRRLDELATPSNTSIRIRATAAAEALTGDPRR